MSEKLIRLSDAIKAIEAEECLGYVECRTERLYNRINAIPTIEPKHGEWIVKKAPNKEYGDIYICPFCKGDVECVPTNFCPHCGADMRKREDK